ncbi:unnamed protein product, partial [Rotaria magnacalcarata]
MKIWFEKSENQSSFGIYYSIENLPAIGEWPKWWRGVTSLYAAE